MRSPLLLPCLLAMLMTVPAAAGVDGDGVPDAVDNCVLVPNADQADADAGRDDDSWLEGIQHYGDACDRDLDDDGVVGASDFFGGFRPCLGADVATEPGCADADFDGDGIVGPSDFFSTLRDAIANAEIPGPGVEELPCPTSQTATYRVEFDGTWSPTTHPQAPPSAPHFTHLIGATHHAGVAFWNPGEPASPGIQDVAELGNGTKLAGEVMDAIDAGTADALLLGGSISPAPGSTTFDVGISASHPLLTLVSMVAPSPDWFVGVHGVELRRNGEWLESIEITLFAYDAGTDSGIGFESPNFVTNPQEMVTRISGFPFLNGAEVPAMGSFRIERIDETGCQP